MRLKGFGYAAIAAIFIASGAYAQTATPDAAAAPAAAAPAKAMKPKPKAVAAKAEKPTAKKLPFVTVTVKNGRGAALTLLTATISGGGDPVKVAATLAPGKTATAHLAHDKDCLFDLHGEYADGASLDESEVELCKDKKINLVD
jgi:hypothetical protein